MKRAVPTTTNTNQGSRAESIRTDAIHTKQEDVQQTATRHDQQILHVITWLHLTNAQPVTTDEIREISKCRLSRTVTDLPISVLAGGVTLTTAENLALERSGMKLCGGGSGWSLQTHHGNPFTWRGLKYVLIKNHSNRKRKNNCLPKSDTRVHPRRCL